MDSDTSRIDLLPWVPSWSETTWDASFDERLRALSYDVLPAVALDALTNLALDAALLFRVAEGARRPLLRLWDWSERAVILGSFQSVRDAVDVDLAAQHGFSIARRISGGGAMVVEPLRTVTYSLIVPEAAVDGLSFVQSFACLDRWVVQALRSIGVPATYRPINDIASPDAKIGGAAQCRRKRTVLHHATLAYDIDHDLMPALLRHGQAPTNVKGVPSARKRVSPLSLYTTLPREHILDWLSEAFLRMHNGQLSSISNDEMLDTRTRIATQFATPEWLYRVE
jgi:lipoate-protein ligase A